MVYRYIGINGHVFQTCEQLAGNQCKYLENVQCPTVIVSLVLGLFAVTFVQEFSMCVCLPLGY